MKSKVGMKTVCAFAFFIYSGFVFSGDTYVREVPEEVRRAIWTDNDAAVKSFLRKTKISPESWTMYGMPLLHKCGVEGASKCVEVILNAYPETLYLQDSYTHDTVLHVTVARNVKPESEKMAMITLLLSRDTRGTLCRLRNCDRKTAYDIACKGAITRYVVPQDKTLHGVFGGKEHTEYLGEAWPHIPSLVDPASVLR